MEDNKPKSASVQLKKDTPDHIKGNRKKLASSQPVSCSQCQKLFSNKANMKLHFKTVHGDDKNRFQCQECDYSSSQKITLLRHINALHLSKKLNCTMCPMEYKWDVDLRRHMESEHGQNKLKFLCGKCGKVCKTKRALSRHQESHKEKRTICCTICSAQISSNSLKSHMKFHHTKDLKKNICDLCPFESIYLSDLKRHRDEVHGKAKKFSCSRCSYQSFRKRGLEVHLTKKHNVKEINKDFMTEADKTTIKVEEENFSEVMCQIPDCKRLYNFGESKDEHYMIHHYNNNEEEENNSVSPDVQDDVSEDDEWRNLSSKCGVCLSTCHGAGEICNLMIRGMEDV